MYKRKYLPLLYHVISTEKLFQHTQEEEEEEEEAKKATTLPSRMSSSRMYSKTMSLRQKRHTHTHTKRKYRCYVINKSMINDFISIIESSIVRSCMRLFRYGFDDDVLLDFLIVPLSASSDFDIYKGASR